MNVYHPSKEPDSGEWLSLDESIRIELVKRSHEASEVEFEEERQKELHSIIHVIVENQVAEKVPTVTDTISKLMRQGLSRHESVHAVGAVLSEDIFEMLKQSKEFDIKKYRRRLEKLTAKRWNKGKW